MKNKSKPKFATVWTCDFCGEEFSTKKESNKHELTCKKNPEKYKILLRFKKYLIISVICLIVFFTSLYFGGIKNGSFNENYSLEKDIALLILISSVVIGTVFFSLMIHSFNKFSVYKNKTKKPNSGTIFGWASLFIFIYFIIYVVANANAQNNSLPPKNLLQPQKWFSSEIKKEITPTPTHTIKITLTPTPTLKPKVQVKPTSVPTTLVVTSDMVNCNVSSNCGGGTKYIKKSECDNSVCCQIGGKWIFYTSKQKCNEDQSKNNSGNYVRPTSVPIPTYKPIQTAPTSAPYVAPTTSQEEQDQSIIDQYNSQVIQCKQYVNERIANPLFLKCKVTYPVNNSPEALACESDARNQISTAINNCGELY